MRLSTILLFVLLLLTVIKANAQFTLKVDSGKSIKITKCYRLYINPVIIGETRQEITPREIFFKYWPNITKDNYYCWVESNFDVKSKQRDGIKCIDVGVNGCNYTFEEFKQYLFNYKP